MRSNSFNDKVKAHQEERDARVIARSQAKGQVQTVKTSTLSLTDDREEEEAVQYIERRINDDGNEEIRMCELGFIPTDVNEPRYSTLRHFTIQLVSEILLENLPQGDDKNVNK